MKKGLYYEIVPSVADEDINRSRTVWKNGKCISIDLGKDVVLYLGHRSINGVDEPLATEAFPVKVEKPVTRDKAINSAEMAAYGLHNAMEVASFNASLARKARSNSCDSEVIDHDEFISWVKDRLDEIGVVSK